MAAGLKSIVVKFIGDVTGLTSASEKAGKDLGGVASKSEESGKRMSGALKFAAIGAGVGIAVEGVKSLGGKLFDLAAQAQDSARASAATAQVIKTTGGAAGITAAQVDALSTALSNKNGVDDDAIRAGANMLLTFTGIKNAAGKNNDIFNQATQITTDMTAAMNQGVVTNENMQKTSIQVGKALNDPIKGITALSKVGVSFTDQQKAQIKTMVKHNDTMGAQKVILAELGKEFGGQAAAQSSAGQKASVAWGNFQKQVGGYILPLVSSLFTWLYQRVIPAFATLADWINKKAVPAFKQLGQWIQQNVVPVLQKLWQWMAQNIPPALQAVWGWIQNRLIPAFKSIWQFLASQLIPTIEKFYKQIAQSLIPVLQTLWKQIQTNILPALKTLWGVFKNDLWPVIKLVIGIVGDLVAFIVGKVVPVLLNLAGPIIKKLVSAIAGIADGIKDVVNWFKKLPGQISSAFGDAKNYLVQIGKDLIEGLKNGITNAASGLWDTVKSIPGKALGLLKSGFGIFSPSKKTATMGVQLMQGLQQGIGNGYPLVSAAIQNAMDAASVKFAKGTKGIVEKGEAALTALNLKLDDPVKGIVAKLDTATGALSDLKSAAADMRSSIGGSFTGLVDVSSFGGQGNGALLSSLSTAVATGSDFSSAIKRLQALHLNSTAIGQLLAAGPAAADAAASQLAAGGQGVVDQVNQQFATLAAQGDSLGKFMSDSTYGAGIKAGQGLIKGLQSQQAAIEKQISDLSSGIVKAIKKALGIKSPSTVFAEVGRQITAGLAVGITSNAAVAHAAVGALSGRLVAAGGAAGASSRGQLAGARGADIHLSIDLGEGIKQRISVAQNQRDRATRAAVTSGGKRAFV